MQICRIGLKLPLTATQPMGEDFKITSNSFWDQFCIMLILLENCGNLQNEILLRQNGSFWCADLWYKTEIFRKELILNPVTKSKIECGTKCTAVICACRTERMWNPNGHSNNSEFSVRSISSYCFFILKINNSEFFYDTWNHLGRENSEFQVIIFPHIPNNDNSDLYLYIGSISAWK